MADKNTAALRAAMDALSVSYNKRGAQSGAAFEEALGKVYDKGKADGAASVDTGALQQKIAALEATNGEYVVAMADAAAHMIDVQKGLETQAEAHDGLLAQRLGESGDG